MLCTEQTEWPELQSFLYTAFNFNMLFCMVSVEKLNLKLSIRFAQELHKLQEYLKDKNKFLNLVVISKDEKTVFQNTLLSEFEINQKLDRSISIEEFEASGGESAKKCCLIVSDFPGMGKSTLIS